MQALQVIRSFSFSTKKELSAPVDSQSRSFLHQLPCEAQREIFRALDIHSLLNVLILDKSTRSVIDSVDFWNSLILRDRHSWKLYGSTFAQWKVSNQLLQLKARLFSKPDEPTPVERAKAVYFQHQLELLPREKSFSLDFRSTAPVVPMFGEAGSGYGFAKKLLYNMMWTEHASLQLHALVPGNQGVGSGVAFKIEGRALALSAVSKTNERNIFECMKEAGPWRDFYHQAGGAVMVVNACYPLETSREELRAHLVHLQPTAPLLVLVVDPGSGGPLHTPYDVAQALHLHQLERAWRVRACSLKDSEGIYEGLQWLKRCFLF